MTKILLLLICCLLLAACSVAPSSNTLGIVRVDHEYEIEALPVAADLRVLEQKTAGEASGKLANRSELEMEALAKAIGQRMPLVDKPDLLVGANVYTETSGDSIKVTITGYPAYYANFRTATAEDIYRLDIAKASQRPLLEAPEEQVAEKPAEKTSRGYFTLRWALPVSEGISGLNFNIGGGQILKHDFFYGFEIGATPAEVLSDEWYAGGGMNFGKSFDLQYLQLFCGASAGFWFTEKVERVQVLRQGSNMGYSTEKVYRDKVNVIGLFLGARWEVLEFVYRVFPDIAGLSRSTFPMEKDGVHHQFMVGVNL